MKIATRSWLKTVALTGTVALGLMGAHSAAQAETYKGTAYVAGMGGHFAKAEFEIDPSQETPITVKKLTKMDIGDGASHPVHDARIDCKDRNTMYWSTYKLDPATGAPHVGKTDLKTGEVSQDEKAAVPVTVKVTKQMYCASAQTNDYFMPISMSNPGFIDVYQKSGLKRAHTVFLEGTDADIKKPYKYYHGVNSPDMTKVVLAINEADKPHGTTVGKLHLVAVDAKALEQGKVKVLAKGIAPGAEKATISFRQYYSNDGKLIANSGGDRLFIIDADSLKVKDAEMVHVLEQNHDAIFTPDDKYVVLTLRTKVVNQDCPTPLKPGPDEYLMDGQLRLYDVKQQKIIGKPTSVCLACHNQEELDVHAVLCGIDVNWQ